MRAALWRSRTTAWSAIFYASSQARRASISKCWALSSSREALSGILDGAAGCASPGAAPTRSADALVGDRVKIVQ